MTPSPLLRLVVSLDHDGLRRRAKGADILGIGCDDPVPSRSSAKDDGSVDHVGRSSDATQLAGLASPLIVERFDSHFT